MSGLLLIFGVGGWALIAAVLSSNAPRWLGMTRGKLPAGIVLFVFLLLIPLADEWIGMWQFRRLCAERAVANFSADASEVRAARKLSLRDEPVFGTIINIRALQVAYADVATGKVFLRYEILYTRGGRVVGITRFGSDISCSPDYAEINRRVDIDKLLKNGKSK